MNLLKDFTKFEKMWVSIFTFLIMSTTIYFSATMTDYGNLESVLMNWLISPVSALTGIICVILVAKGKISTFIWGFVNCLTYGYIAYRGGVYGDAIINIFYFLPLQIIGWLVWKTKMDGTVVKSQLLKHPIGVIFLAIFSWFAFTKLLTSVDHWLSAAMLKTSAFYDFMPKGWGAALDAFTEIGQFFGQALLTMCKWEQWIAWILINIVSIYMWVCIAIGDPTSYPYSIPTILMWIAYLLNSFYGLSQWKKRAV